VVERQQEVLGGDVLVPELAHLLLTLVEQLGKRRRSARLLARSSHGRPGREPRLAFLPH
jgi:hypothetical protein